MKTTEPAPRSTLVGREREFAELCARLEDAVASHGSLLLVVGEAGIGKTRLVEELGASAAERGIGVLWGRCWEGGGAPPYWPWVQALRAALHAVEPERRAAALGTGAPLVAQLVPDSLEALPHLSATPSALESEHARFYLFDAVATFLKNAAATTPLALIFDDLQWADTSSLLLLQFLAREVRDARILVVGTYRELEASLQAPAVAASLGLLAREGHQIPLRGLSEGEVARFIEQTAGRVAAAALVRLVHRETEGNPFFVDEVVRLLAAEGSLEEPAPALAGSLPVPQGVREAIRRRLSPLPGDCADLLTVASVLGCEFDLAQLGRAGGLRSDELLEVISPALTHGIIVGQPGTRHRFRFSHALVREALYEQISPAARARLHGRTGEALEEFYQADPEPHLAELAHHFLEAAPAGYAAKGIDYCRRAGRGAAATLAYEEAAVLYGRALELLTQTESPEEAARGHLLLDLGAVQWRTRDGADARATFRRAAEIARRTGAPLLLAQSALGAAGEAAGRLWLRSGVVDESLVALLEEALEAMGERDDALRARLHACLAVELYYSASRGRSVVLSEQAVALARRSGDQSALAAALRARCVALWRLEDADERLAAATETVRLAEEAGVPELGLPGRRFRIIGLLEGGDVGAVRREVDACGRIASDLRQPFYLACVARWRAMLALLEGRFAEAEREAEQSLELARRAGDEEDARAGFAFQLAALRLLQGRVEDAARLVEPLVGHRQRGQIPRFYLIQVYCERGQSSEARRELAALVESGFAPRGSADSRWLYGTCALSTLYARVGDRVSAALLHDLLLPYAGRVAVASPGIVCGGAVSHALGELEATLGLYEDAVRHFDDALRAHERMGARPLAASTASAYAQALLARGAPADRERARELLAQALAAARELGMQILEKQVRALDPGAGSPAARAEPSPAARVFQREGDFWTIAYEGKVVRLKDAKGLGDLGLLLASPGRPVHVTDLIAASAAVGPDPRAAGLRGMTREQLAEHGLRVTTAGADVAALDGQARSEYRTRLADLRRELEDAARANDPGRASRAQSELDFITDELVRAHGLGNRSRRSGTPIERARKAVTWRIRESIARLEREHPPLGTHLRRFIRTGTFCSYAVPEDSPPWRV